MGRGNPCGPPALVILMAATMPATAGTGQAAITQQGGIAPARRLTLREHGGEFVIETSLDDPAPVRFPPIQVGRSVHLDRALLAPKMQTRSSDHDEPQSSPR